MNLQLEDEKSAPVVEVEEMVKLLKRIVEESTRRELVECGSVRNELQNIVDGAGTEY